MRTRLVVIFLLIFLTLVGCTDNTLESMQEQLTKTDYIGYIQKEVKLSKLEPIYGSYLGAYVLSSQELEYDIRRFEASIDKEVAITIRNCVQGQEIPSRWLLECIANKKTPYINLNPKYNEPYSIEDLQKTIYSIANNYHDPIFLELNLNSYYKNNPKRYIQDFKMAYEISNDISPLITIVWGIDIEDVYDSILFYPGDDYVDWAGISIYIPIYKDGIKYYIDWAERLDYFYKTYSSSKPVVISKLGISHYSSVDHTFYIDDAINIIENIYTSLPKKYPRVKAINYIDIDNIRVAPYGVGQDNFKISSNTALINKYKSLIKEPYYLSLIDNSFNTIGNQWLQVSWDFYKDKDKLYVDEKAIKQELKEPYLLSNGYCNLDDFTKELGLRYIVNNNIIKIYK